MSLRGQETRRRMSGFLASVLVFVFVFEQFFMSLSYAGVSGNVASPSDAVRGGRVSYQSSEAGPVQIAVMSDEAIYESGDDVCLDLYIKNNTDQEISDGKLTFKTKGIEEGSGYFEDMGAVYEDVLAEMIAAEGGDGNTSFKVKYDNGNDDEDMEDLGEEDAVKLTGLDMEPGEIHHVLFHFTVKDEEVSKSQKIRFNFEGKVESGRVRAQTTFHYAAGAMNLLPVQIGEKGKLEAGEAGSMLLDFELGNIEDIILEKEAENEDSALSAGKTTNSTDSNAGKASASNAWIKWEDETTTSKRKEEQPVIKGLECSVNISGVKLNNFKVEKKGDDDYGTSTVCTFNVEENVQPGVYYGEVTAKYRVGSKSFTSTQGIAVVVNNDAVVSDEAVLEVIEQINELPELEEVEGNIAAFDEKEDEEGCSQYFIELNDQVMPVWEMYQALGDEQKEQVSNRTKLLALTVVEVIREIDKLPGEEELSEKAAAIESEEEQDQYLMELYRLVMPVWEMYNALSDEQKEQVINSEKLLMYDWLLVMQMDQYDGEGVFMVQFPRNTNASEHLSANKWTPLTWKSPSLNYLNGWSSFSGNDLISLHLVGVNNGTYNGTFRYGIYGKVAYCIEPGVKLDFKVENGPGKTFTEKGENWWKNGMSGYADAHTDATGKKLNGEKLKVMIGRVIAEGYNGTVYSEWNETNKDKVCQALATQLLVWETVVGERDLDSFQKLTITTTGKSPVKDFISKSKNSNGINVNQKHDWYNTINTHYNRIAEAVEEHAKKPALERQGEWTWDETKKRYEIILKDKNKVLDYCNITTSPSGSSVAGAERIGESNQIRVWAKQSNTAVTVTVTNKKTSRCGLVVWGDTNYAQGNTGNQDVVTFTDTTTSDIVENTITVTAPGNSIKIQKKGRDKEILSGVTFELIKSGSQTGERYTTNESGIIQLPSLTPGIYMLKETQSKSGYQFLGNKDNVYSFTVTANGVIFPSPSKINNVEVVNVNNNIITVYNDREYADLKIIKTIDEPIATSLGLNLDDTFNISVTLGNGGTDKETQNDGAETEYQGDGVYKFTLKRNEERVIKGIPVGTTYRVEEDTNSLPEGYSKEIDSIKTGSIEGNQDPSTVKVNVVGINNHFYKTTTIDIDVKKNWVDGDETISGTDSRMPLSIDVALMQKGSSNDWTQVAAGTLSSGNNGHEPWYAEFKDLPEYEGENAASYQYKIKEVAISYPENSQYYAERIGDTNIFKILKKAEKDKEKDKQEIIGLFRAEESANGNSHVLDNIWIPVAQDGQLTFTIEKIDEEKNNVLDGAVFELLKDDKKTPVKVEVENEGVYEEKEDLEITNGASTFVIKNPVEGNYFLREKTAPEGYKKIDELIPVTFSKELVENKGDETDQANWTNVWKWTATAGQYDLEDGTNIFQIPNERIKINITKKLDFYKDEDREEKENPYGYEETYKDQEYTFVVYEVDGEGNRTKVDRVSLKTDDTVSTTELLKGDRYVIVEESSGKEFANYTWNGVEYKLDGAEATKEEDGLAITIDGTKELIDVEATNSYTRNKANLVVKKRVDYSDTTSYKPDPDKEYTINVTLGSKSDTVAYILNGNSVDYIDEGLYELHVKGEEAITIKGIPAGIPYVVEEPRVLADGSETADSRYTFGGILKNGELVVQPEKTTAPEESAPEGTTPEGSESEGLDEMTSASDETLSPADETMEGEVTVDDSIETELPSPDGTEEDVPVEDIPTEEVTPVVFSQKYEEGIIPGLEGTDETEEVTVINHFYDVKMITVKSDKSWKTSSDLDLAKISSLNDLLPESIDIVLMRKLEGAEGTDVQIGEPEQLNRENGWSYTFDEQPQYPEEGSKIAYEYYVVEKEINYAADTPDQTEPEYIVKQIEGTDIFKIMRRETDNGRNEVVGVFEVKYQAASETTDEEGSKVKVIAVDNIWKSATRVDRGEAGFDITKIGNEDSTPLVGAVFALKPEGTVNGVTRYMVSDDNGHLAFGNLPVGQYTMTEYRAPEGYQKLDTQWTINVTKVLNAVTPNENDQTIWTNEWLWSTEIVGNEGTQLTVGNDKIQGSISIAKTLTLNGQPDTNMTYRNNAFTFAIYEGTDLTRTPAATMTIRPNGEEEVTGELNYGIYTIVEVSRIDADGYTWENVEFVGEDADTDAPGFQVMISQPDQVVVVSAINHYIREEETTTTNEEETTTPGESEGGTLPEESTEESSEEETTAPETTSGGNGGGGNGGGNGGGGGGDRSRVVNRPTDVITDDDVPLVNITPEDVPLADMPEETETPLVILDEDVPLVGLAKTGDSSMSVGVLMGMMILSLLAALGVAKRQKEEE